MQTGRAALRSDPRAVAIFDVLGIKNGIETGRSADIARRYADMLGLIDQLKSTPVGDSAIPTLLPVSSSNTTQPEVHVFSDTIILISENSSFEAAARLLIMAWRLMQAFFSADLPLRGAVAFGELHTVAEHQIYIGPALVRAHELEAAQAWAGAVIDPSFLERYPPTAWEGEGLRGLYDIVFPEYAVPFKKSRSSEIEYRMMRVINWRTQLVRDTGFSKPALDYYGKRTISELHPYLQRAFDFAKSHQGYLMPQEAIPAEFRTFWIGKTQPPFPNGDEVW